MANRLLVLLVLAMVLGGLSAKVSAETIVVPASGEYAGVDTKLANETVRLLLRGSTDERNSALKRVLTAPESYAPPVLYAASSVLFAEGKKDDAAVWFYRGQLRSRCDGTLCTDRSAQEGTAVLNYEYGTPINQYMFQHVDQLKAMVPKVVEWDRVTPHKYDRRWMTLHGMGAFIDDAKDKKSIVIPQSEWEKSDEKVRTTYLDNFNQAMKELEAKGTQK